MDNKYIPVGDFLDKSASKVKDDDDWDAWSDNQDVPTEDLLSKRRARARAASTFDPETGNKPAK